MSKHARGTVTTKSWDEAPWSEIEGGGNITRASIVNAFQGDIEGEGTLQYLMVYRGESFARFIGLERVVGTLGGRSGSFVLEHNGTFEDGVVKGVWSVVPGSGTGDLSGLSGEGTYVWAGEHAEALDFTLNYELS